MEGTKAAVEDSVETANLAARKNDEDEESWGNVAEAASLVNEDEIKSWV